MLDPYRLLFENNPLPIWIYDPETLYFLLVNDSAVHLYGYSRDEFLSMTVRELIPAEDIPEHKGNASEIVNKARRPHIKKDGNTIYVEIISHSITFRGRKAEVVLVNDITERTQMEEALRESEARFRATFNDAAIGISRVDMLGQIVETNPAMRKILGLSKKELDHTLITEITYQDDVTADWDLFCELIDGKRDYYQMEKRYYKKDGSLIWAQLTVSLVRDASGDPQFAIAMVEDITEQKKAEEELKIRAQLLDAATDAIFVHDLEGNFVYLNEAAYRSRGFSKNEMMKMNIHDVVNPEYAGLIESRIKELLEKGEAVFESVHKCKNNSTIPVEVHSRIVESGGRKLILSVNRNITERKQAEKMLKEKARSEMFGLLVSALPVFASGVPSHVRNTLVGAFSERFEKNIRPRFEEKMDYFGYGLETRRYGVPKPEKVLELFISWLSDLFSNLGIRTGKKCSGSRGCLELLECSWIGEARCNAIFCLICRAIVNRSFGWTFLNGGTIQKTSIAGHSNTCRFEIHLSPEVQGSIIEVQQWRD